MNLPVMYTGKKALPRELLDDYFRLATHDIPNEQLWEMSAQLTELGKCLSDLKVTIDSPDIPLLGIKGGLMIYNDLFIGTLSNVFGERSGEKKCVMQPTLIGTLHPMPKDFPKKNIKR